jgi:hypothetical protein
MSIVMFLLVLCCVLLLAAAVLSKDLVWLPQGSELPEESGCR